MKFKNLIVAMLCTASCVSAFGNTSVNIKEKINLHDMTCSTFIDLGPEYHGKVVYWTASRLEKTPDKDIYIGLGSMESLVPSVVEYCKAAPGENFYETVKIKYKTNSNSR